MAADVSPIVAPTANSDPRLQPGSYITDGEDLDLLSFRHFGSRFQALDVEALVSAAELLNEAGIDADAIAAAPRELAHALAG